MRIIWDELTRDEWRKALMRVPRSNLLNTWGYAQAMRNDRQMMTRFGVVQADGEDRALIEMQQFRLGPFLHIMTLHRGPLWLDAPASPKEWRQFLTLLSETYPRRLGRIRRLLPELEASPEALALMTELGFERIGEGYETLWLDLSKTEEDLRSGLHQKWRNALKGAEQAGLDVELDEDGRYTAWILEHYQADKTTKDYTGASPQFLSQMISAETSKKDTLVFRALHGKEAIAGILVFCHGTSATYQVGWTSDEGRSERAHNLLLWRAMLHLKNVGYQWFDLGGINPGDAEGVTRFKRRMGGEAYTTIGLYK